jgi:hypothetical protein
MRWGWEESCDAAFMRVLPESFDPVDPEESVSFVQIRDLDLITLLGSGVEGLLDSCDRDGSGKLEGSLWSGHDELDCTVTRAKDGVTRLMESGILKMGDWGERNRTEILLQAANTLFLGRHFGKLALIKGHPVSMPFFGIWKPATLGSMLSLLGKL